MLYYEKLSITSFKLTIISQVFYRGLAFLMQEWNSWNRAAFKNNLQASLLTVCGPLLLHAVFGEWLQLSGLESFVYLYYI